MNNKENVSIIARLMSQENISVTFDSVETAQFDLRNRELTLPIYEGLSKETETALLTHEIGHALYTPYEDWSDFVKGDQEKSQITNVIEDARIEKIVQKRYPGTRRDFREGYNELHEKDFFGLSDVDDIQTLTFIDRVNLYFKSYGNVDVAFTKDELSILRMIQTAETFDDVKTIINQYFDNNNDSQNEQPEEQESGQGESNDNVDYDETREEDHNSDEHDSYEDGDTEDDDDTEDDGETTETMDASDNGEDTEEEKENNGDDVEIDYHNDDDNEDEDTENDDETTGKGENDDDTLDIEDKEDTPTDTEKTHKGSNRKEIPETQENFDMALRRYMNVDNSYSRTLPFVYVENEMIDNKWKDFIITDKAFVRYERDVLHNNFMFNETDIVTEYKTYHKENSTIINNMVKEFQMKQSAEEQKRTSVSKTGSIDLNRLYQYQLTDDIFLSEETVETGQNHGIVMYVDFSGSMSGTNIKQSMAQVFNMAAFADKVGIPYTVYAFANGGKSYQDVDKIGTLDFSEEDTRYFQTGRAVADQLRRKIEFGGVDHKMYARLPAGFRLINILDSNMKKKDKMLALGLIASAAQVPINGRERAMKGRYIYNFFENYSGGTPLNTALYIAPYIIQEFVKNNNITKPIFMLYTDGGAADSYWTFEKYYNINDEERIDDIPANEAKRFIDRKGNIVWNNENIKPRRGTDTFQNVLTDRIRKLTGSILMAFDIVPKKGFEYIFADAGRMKNTTVDNRELEDQKKAVKKEGYYHVTNIGHIFDSFTFILETTQLENRELDDELGEEENPSNKKLQSAFMKSNRKNKDSRFLVKRLMEVLA